MGDAAWFDHHGFEQSRAMQAPPLALEIRVNRPMPVFEFLEPVVVELKLQNISAMPQVVDENILTTLDGITIALKRQGSPARQFLPFAQYLHEVGGEGAAAEGSDLLVGVRDGRTERRRCLRTGTVPPPGGDAYAPGRHRLEAVHAARGDPERDGRGSRRAGLLHRQSEPGACVRRQPRAASGQQGASRCRRAAARSPRRQARADSARSGGRRASQGADDWRRRGSGSRGNQEVLQSGGGTASTRRVGVEGGADEPPGCRGRVARARRL